MHIGLDLDSVLADIMPALNQFHNDRYGTRLQLQDYTCFALSPIWHCSEAEVYRRVYEFYDSPYMDSVPPLAGAQEAIAYLRLKADLFVITSRPLLIRDKTENWLYRYFKGMFDQVVLTNQLSQSGNKRLKSEVGLELGLDAMVDDSLEFATDCADHGIMTYLMDMPWNQENVSHPRITRLMGWEEAAKYW